MSSLPIVVFACDCLYSAMPRRHIENSESTLNLFPFFDHCTVRYGTGRVGRYGYLLG